MDYEKLKEELHLFTDERHREAADFLMNLPTPCRGLPRKGFLKAVADELVIADELPALKIMSRALETKITGEYMIWDREGHWTGFFRQSNLLHKPAPKSQMRRQAYAAILALFGCREKLIKRLCRNPEALALATGNLALIERGFEIQAERNTKAYAEGRIKKVWEARHAQKKAEKKAA